jgi:hypothetical protein
VIYGLPCAHYAPDLDQLTGTLHALSRYGIPGPSAVGQGTPLADALLALAATHPVDVYALAAQHGLHDLVVRVSAHVLCISLATVSDAQADAMGALYLKRLFFLHLGRADAFKRLLLVPPAEHLPTVVCGVGERAKLTRAWALASAYLSWDGRPGMSDSCRLPGRSLTVSSADVPPSTIEATVRPLSIGIECERCRTALATRLQTLILQWSLVKVRVDPLCCAAYANLYLSGRYKQNAHGGRSVNTPLPLLVVPVFSSLWGRYEKNIGLLSGWASGQRRLRFFRSGGRVGGVVMGSSDISRKCSQRRSSSSRYAAHKLFYFNIYAGEHA